MASIGYIQAHIYTSNAQLPLRDVPIVITTPDNTAIAMRVTDRSGLIGPIPIPVPERSESQEPGAEEKPYALVNLTAEYPGYEGVFAENLQIFADVITYQDLEMIPLSAVPTAQDEIIHYDTPPQNL